jgi:hypothetical protein
MAESSSGEHDPAAIESNEEPPRDGRSPIIKWLGSSEGYSLLIPLALLGLILLSEGIVHARGGGFLPHDTSRVKILRTVGAFALSAPFLGFTGACIYLNWSAYRGRRRATLAELRSATFPQRADLATAALKEATVIVEELKTELEARMALLAEVKRQIEDTEQRAREMERLSLIDEDTTRTLNRYFDEALARRLGDLERGSRRREWLIGTIGALSFGVIAILVVHYLFGF